MKLHRLTLYRFGSFQSEQTLKFPDAPGLYFVQGINRAEPRLEANGSGKSTLWKALYWVLFGRTPEGLKAGDAANWEEGKGAYVELAFGDGVGLQVVRRSWSPNAWTLQDLFGNVTDLTKDSTNPVLQALRLEAMPFLSSVLMAQGEPMFLDLKADAQAALFANVMGLDKWVSYSGNASKKAGSQDLECRRLERELAGLRGKLDSLQDIDVTAKAESWEAGREVKLRDIEDDHAKRMEQWEKLKAAIPDVAGAAVSLRASWNQACTFSDDLKKVNDRQGEKIRDLETKLREADFQRDLALTQIVDIAEKGICPTCGQEMRQGHNTKHLSELEQTAKRHKGDGRALYAELQHARQRFSNGEQAYKKALLDESGLEGRLRDAESDARRMALEVTALERDIDRLEDEAQELEKQENPYLAIQRDQSSARDKLKAEVEQAERLLRSAEERYAIFNYWVRGFKEVRLQLIAEALDELEIEVNNNVTELGLVNWELQFDVDRETKGGGISRGFSVRVISPHNGRAVPWAAWSGGERQRLRIAAQMGLANLIRNRTGATIELEVWDEPTQGMPAQGVNDLLQCLKRRAMREQRQIWMVDHHVLSYGGFDGVCTVTKTSRKGSTVDWV